MPRHISIEEWKAKAEKWKRETQVLRKAVRLLIARMKRIQKASKDI
jgi:hypothetical protein